MLILLYDKPLEMNYFTIVKCSENEDKTEKNKIGKTHCLVL